VEKPINIDNACAEDLPAMVGLLNELFSIERDFIPDAAKQERGLRLILDNPAIGRIFVVRVEGRAVGMASLLFTVSTAEGGLAAVLEDVIVAAPYRRLKVGRRLVRHVRQWAQEQGVIRLTLLADKSNGAALRFYESEGFASSETMVVYRYHLDEVEQTQIIQ
jgi:GNAT superfamily N-acetyltransferase